MNAPTIATARRTWFVIWGALTIAPFFYAFLAARVAPTVVPSPSLGPLRIWLLASSAVGFALAFLVMRTAARAPEPPSSIFATRGDGQPATPVAFQARSIYAMALFESVAVSGFVLVFLGLPPLLFLPWGAASVAAQLAVVLPAALSYWNEVERTSAGTGAIG